MRILSITGNRADYDLMSYLYRYFNNDPDIDFGLVVTGAHLSSDYGNSLSDIEKDGNHIAAKIEDILNSDHPGSRAKSTGILLQALIDTIRTFEPDLLIAPGDREDVIAMAIAAVYMRIPLVHFFGGDHSDSGHVDNDIRHAVSKMATVHFVSAEEHKRRLLALGEEERRIYVTGSVALDKFIEEPHLSAREVMNALSLKDFENYALLIYHPPAEIPGENKEIDAILKTLKKKNIKTVVSYPNTDANSHAIIEKYALYQNDPGFYFYKNLSRNLFINLYRNALFQIGNSSAGVNEAASIPIPVINIGSRQRNRGNSGNVIYVENYWDGLDAAIDLAMSKSYRDSIQNMKNILNGGNSKKAYELIKTIDFRSLIHKNYDPLRGYMP